MFEKNYLEENRYPKKAIVRKGNFAAEHEIYIDDDGFLAEILRFHEILKNGERIISHGFVPLRLGSVKKLLSKKVLVQELDKFKKKLPYKKQYDSIDDFKANNKNNV